MTQEEKSILLKDLCARLPYGVILHIKYYDISHDNKLKSCDRELGCGNIGYCFNRSHWVEYKPYLRSISSMTEEEYNELMDIPNIEIYHNGRTISNGNEFDYILSHHFDYRGLIEKGLALEAPTDMYNKK